MNRIPRPLSSKNQITIPKTVRDLLELNDCDSIDFVIDSDNRVYIEKSLKLQICPFCGGDDFYGYQCPLCDGTGTLESLEKEFLVNKLLKYSIDMKISIYLDTKDEFISVKFNEEDDYINLVREHFQLELIRVVLKDYSIKDLLNKELKLKLLSYLKLERTKNLFDCWWDTMVYQYTERV